MSEEKRLTETPTPSSEEQGFDVRPSNRGPLAGVVIAALVIALGVWGYRIFQAQSTPQRTVEQFLTAMNERNAARAAELVEFPKQAAELVPGGSVALMRALFSGLPENKKITYRFVRQEQMNENRAVVVMQMTGYVLPDGEHPFYVVRDKQNNVWKIDIAKSIVDNLNPMGGFAFGP